MKTSSAHWVVGLAGILALDALIVKRGRESLSECYARNLRHPVKGPMVALSTVYLVTHLANVGGERFKRFDPLHQAAERFLR